MLHMIQTSTCESVTREPTDFCVISFEIWSGKWHGLYVLDQFDTNKPLFVDTGHMLCWTVMRSFLLCVTSRKIRVVISMANCFSLSLLFSQKPEIMAALDMGSLQQKSILPQVNLKNGRHLTENFSLCIFWMNLTEFVLKFPLTWLLSVRLTNN